MMSAEQRGIMRRVWALAMVVAGVLLLPSVVCAQASITGTVKDSSGQLIGSLNKGDFTVYDNGVKQDIAVFDRQTEQPLSVAMLVDTSASTGIELHYESLFRLLGEFVIDREHAEVIAGDP